MDTDYAVPMEVDRIRARVSKVMDTDAGSEEVQTWVSVFSVSDDASGEPGVHGLPATFGILPDDSDLDREIVIELEALANGSDQALVSRRVKTGFVSGEARLVRILLYRACAGVSCSAGQTCGCSGALSCVAPSCIDEMVRPEDLELIDNPGVLPPDAGIPILDGSVPDGSIPPDDAGTEPDASMPDGGGINCGEPLTICGLDCVNTQADPRYCGDCDTACAIGHICDAGNCMDAGDCRTNGIGCSGFTYCEQSSGECLPGCSEHEQCTGAHQLCDQGIHDCICAPGFDPCGIGCVDTQIDPSFCGNCTTMCPTGHVCEVGLCVDPGDCRTNGVGCSGFTYCDVATGDCLRGCGNDAQCTGANEVCNTLTHECVCAIGHHQCGDVCVSDLDVNSCGASCTPCPAPPNASPTCNLGACDFACDGTYERCDQMCCPTSCPPGQALYNRACAALHLQTADAQGNVGEHTSIALDVADLAHIAYYAQNGKDLRHAAQQADASWTSQMTDSQGDVGQHTSAAFDATGVLYVAYYDASDRDLMLATRPSGGAWTVEVVDGQGDVGEYTSLALDAAGAPHISYFDNGNKDLMYAKRQSGGTWAVEIVDSVGDVGQHTSLALGPSGAVHIGYYDSTDRDLRYAARQDGGSWAAQTIASDGDVGKYTSLALDATGAPHISYYGEDTRDLLYAWQLAGGSWTTETVESQGDVGKYTSLAIDEAGAARLTYFDESARDLKYAIQPPGAPWVLQAVDSVGDVGRFTSIAVDSLGNAHVSYYDATNSNLRYALIAALAPTNTTEIP
jgi:hypothetical protein